MRLLVGRPDVKIDMKRMEEWLKSLSASTCGYKDYYTVRKRVIHDAMTLGIDQREYWANCGRLMELKQMNTLSLDLIKRDDKKSKLK